VFYLYSRRMYGYLCYICSRPVANCAATGTIEVVGSVLSILRVRPSLHYTSSSDIFKLSTLKYISPMMVRSMESVQSTSYSEYHPYWYVVEPGPGTRYNSGIGRSDK